MKHNPTSKSIIEADLAGLLGDLLELGYSVGETQYDEAAFGDYYVAFVGPRRFRITRDRGQYMVEADKDELVSVGLFRAFSSLSELHPKLIKWLKVSNQDRLRAID